ncbi:hypothetical protein [Sphingomonas sp. OK281]|uniref:hypothetical protein n=1 Tax=Sphingomonas sp. OK281 TaxID=1881067 RepID=UPI0008EDDA3A|nr:hypothetical protein [Sphingomonas sp. OK281]SFO16590.1 hypothetical protein SAMN05428984_2437 [Sphingomonas sp. OK281]
MKIIALFAAGALATGTLFAAAPADAQRYGWDGPRGGPGWHGPRGGDRGWHDGRRWDGPRRGYRGYDDGYRGGYRGGYGYRGPRGYGRSRVVCRIERGYYGPVRRCFHR